MNNLVRDTNRSVAVFVNDFDEECAVALKKLAVKLKRPLKGVMLVDKTNKEKGLYRPDKDGLFEQVVCDFSNDVELHEIGKQFEESLLLLTCTSERGQPLLGKIIPHMPYVYGPTQTSLTWSTHKGEMRKMLTAYSSKLAPKVRVLFSADESEVEEAAENVGFPMIIKPTGLAASLLVKRVTDKKELKRALAESFEVINEVYSRDLGRGMPSMIAEEFIEGDMYSVDGYVDFFGKVWLLPLLRVQTGYSQGGEDFYLYQTDTFLSLPDQEIVKSKDTVTDAVHALGLRSTAVHVELFHTKNGWKIIELGSRVGGQRQDIYFKAYGIDHAFNELLVKVGLEPILPTKRTAHVMTFKIHPEREGILEEIRGTEEASLHPSVYRLTTHIEAGAMAKFTKNGGNVLADIMLSGDNKQQLEADAEKIRSMIEVVIKDPKN